MNTNNLPHLNPLCTGMGVLSTNSEAALEKFSSLRLEHFQLYARQLCVSVRKAKALLKSDVRYKPQQAILLIDALVDEVNKTKSDFVGYRIDSIETLGDDKHIENHISPLCITDSTNRMESFYIEKKKQSELLQTEVARLNSTIERLKAENLAQQVEIDCLREALIGEVQS